MSQQAGLIVLYRWKVADTDVEQFHRCWAQATDELRDYGAMGSLLAKESDDIYWAIAQWPDHATRERAETSYPDTADWPAVTRLQTV
ncbi:MAG: hypothetical protein WA908_11550, partial [Pontixanthobacter sp.]